MLRSSLPVYDSYTIGNLQIWLDLTHPANADLSIALVAPDGTRIMLVNAGAAAGANFTNTLLDDASTLPFLAGTGPYSAPNGYQPSTPLAQLLGHNVNGTWQLEVTDTTGGTAGTLNGWSIVATPALSNFTVTPNPRGTDPDPAMPRTYRIGFPSQQLPSSYSLNFSPDARSPLGEPVDTNLNAGVDQVRGTSAVTVPVTFNSFNVPQNVGGATAGTVTTSTITIAEPFLIKNLSLQLNITYSRPADLQAALIAPNGKVLPLFTQVGRAGTGQNFVNTIFADDATTPIQNGAAPFFGRYNPEQPFGTGLTALPNPVANAAGTWMLQITSLTAGTTGRLNNWSLSFDKPVPGTGLGESKVDRFTTAFRIFAEQATNDLSHSAWAPVGAAAQEDNINTVRDDRYTGRISAIVVDPSDPSGNTVYVGAASGGIWKTTNFLTKDPKGPTYVPLTDFGPTLTINIGSIVIYPRNNDPAQSIIFAVTGEGAHRAEDTDSSRGVGFIRSMDGGRTWTLLDSLANADANGNAIPLSLRDHWFLNTTGYKIAVDPQPTPTGEVIVYAALSDVPLSALNHGGIYRSMDTGKTWQLMRAGQATDVSLDMASGHMDAVSNPTGNLDILYAAFRGDGVYSSPNRGVVWNAMLGGLGDPLFRNVGVVTLPAIPVDAPAATPNGATKQRIHLVKPTPTGDSFKDSQYQGWLYVLVTSAAGVLENLYATKDFGQNWTMVHIPLGTNDHTAGNFQIFGSNEAESSSAIAVDPTNPNVLYIAGSIGGIQGRAQLMRIDLTALTDPHALYNADDLADNGTTRGVTGAITTSGGGFYMGATATPYLNLLRDPAAPFLSDSTLYLSGLPGTRFTNLGADAHTIPFDSLQTGDDNQIIVTSVDSLTGQPRLIVGSGTGIYTGVDDDGAYGQSIGTASTPFGFRGGNLQVNQFSFGAAQPSAVAAEAAGALFYGSADDFGTTRSSANVLNTGGISWQPEPRAWDASTGDWDPSTGAVARRGGDHHPHRRCRDGPDGVGHNLSVHLDGLARHGDRVLPGERRRADVQSAASGRRSGSRHGAVAGRTDHVLGQPGKQRPGGDRLRGRARVRHDEPGRLLERNRQPRGARQLADHVVGVWGARAERPGGRDQ